MRWSYTFEYDEVTGTLTVLYADGIGDRSESVYLGEDLPTGTLHSRVNPESGMVEGVRLVLPDWHRTQRTCKLVFLFNVLGPAR